MDAVHRVCHELRRPLAVINAYAELLGDEISGTLNGEQLEHVERILSATDGLAAQFTNLLDLAQSQMAQITISSSQEDLIEVCADVHQRRSERFEAAGLALVLEAPMGGSTHIQTDASLLALSIELILDNALVYAPDQSQITILISDHAGCLRVSVGNSGAPIQAADLECIFEPFERLSESAPLRSGEAGIGLGLTLCRANIEALGGRTWAQPGSVEGMWFHIELPRDLPIIRTGNDPRGNHESANGLDRRHGSGRRA